MKKNRPVDKLYKQIAKAQKKLEDIREVCKHKKTHVGLYSWRVGAVQNATLCDYCDAVVPVISDLFSTVNQTVVFGTNQNNLGKQP